MPRTLSTMHTPSLFEMPEYDSCRRQAGQQIVRALEALLAKKQAAHREIEEVVVDGATMERLEGMSCCHTLACDQRGGKSTIAHVYPFRGRQWAIVGGVYAGGRYMTRDAVALVLRSEFTGQAYHYTDGRASGATFYHGMRAWHDGKEYVLLPLRLRFIWRPTVDLTAFRIVREILDALPTGTGEATAKRALSKAYPFGEKAMTPHHAWCEAVEYELRQRYRKGEKKTALRPPPAAPLFD